MLGLRQRLAIVLACGVLGSAPPAHAQTFPDPASTTVNDYADLLPPEEERALSQRLARLERDTGVEMTVVTLSTRSAFAPDMTLEDYATALFDAWGVGKAATNDGVMVLVFRDDRAMRLELGAAYGRDWDTVARDVVDRSFLDAFAAGDYPRGLAEGTEATIERIVMPFRSGAEAPAGGGGGADGGGGDWLLVAGFLAVALLATGRKWIGDQIVRLRRCPRCGRRGLRQVRNTLMAASPTLAGMGERIRRCEYCGHEERETFPIPRLRRSSGGRSFGGGRSGGGGASGRW